MKKNQLVIYPKFATHHIIYETSSNQSVVEIPISNVISPLHIHASHAFEVKSIQGQNHIVCNLLPNHVQHIDTSPSTNSKALVEIYHEPIEIFIKIESIKWKPTFTLFKDVGQLTCFATITNQSNFEFQTNDIKLIFRSIDHDYKKEKDNRDIPTIDSSNFVEYKLKDKLVASFVLGNNFTLQLWSEKVEMKESIRIDIEIPKPKHLNSFLSFEVPELMLPCEIEIVYRLENNDLLHLGTVYNKIYFKHDILKIMFPMNKSIKIKNKIETKNHSFFIEKTTSKLESKIEKIYQHPLTIEFFTHRPIKNSTLPTSPEEDGHVWEFVMKDKEATFHLEYSY